MFKRNRILQIVIVCAFVSACVTTRPIRHVSTENLEQQLNQLEVDFAAARSDQLDVLAPISFSRAQSAFNQAKQALGQGPNSSAVRDFIAESNDKLKKAAEVAKVSLSILGETNQARLDALKVGADKLGKPYIDIEEEFIELTRAVEKGRLSHARENAANVQTAFRDIEIMAIKENALGEARRLMAEAEKKEIQGIVPKAYSEARQLLTKADDYIEHNPYATEAIAQLGPDVDFMVQRMLTIQESSQKFQEMTPEASALYLESLLTGLGEALNTEDLRDKRVNGQLTALTEAIDALFEKNTAIAKENENHQTRIAELEKGLVEMQGHLHEQGAINRKLAAKQAFSDQFDQVRRQFRAEEAEVYRLCDQLVIRLRGINFPVGQAAVNPESYALLNKVQTAIRQFNQPTVTIEGHTDSTGSVASNLELSQKRADAVKAYLQANNTGQADRIRAIGHGPNQPLALNSTEEGRAMNRRIDLFITPLKTPEAL